MDATTLALAVVVLAAHHDDELLWFEPWLDQASEVVVVMPTTPAHKPAKQLEEKTYGTKIRNLWGRTSDADFMSYWADRNLRESSINYRSTKQLLRRYFQNPKNAVFVTHNPWGEYGHYHHRMLYQAARDLAIEYSKTLFVDGVRYDAGSYTFAETSTSQYRCYDLTRVYAIRDAFQRSVFSGSGIDTWTWHDEDAAIPGYHQAVPYSEVIVNGTPVDMPTLEQYAVDNPLPIINAPDGE